MKNAKCKIALLTFCTLHFALCIGGLAAAAGADDAAVTIAALQADPGRYTLRAVTVTGTVHLVQVLQTVGPQAVPPPGVLQLDTQCAYLHPAYTFVLADETGFLPILVRARPPCVSKDMPREPPELAENDVVVVDVQVTSVERDVQGGRRLVPEALALAIRKQPK